MGDASRLSRKLVLIMKLTAFLIAVPLMLVSTFSFGQTISFKGNEVTLDKLFRQIRKQTGYDLLISTTKIKNAKKVNVDFKNTSLHDVLDAALKGTDLTYSIEGKTIVIAEKEISPPDFTRKQELVTDVRGELVDSMDMALPGASIKIKGSSKATLTNQNGKFYLQGVNRDAVLVISYVGYKVQEVPINKQSFLKIKLLADESLSLREIVVVGYGTQQKETLTGSVESVKGTELAKTPQPNLSNSFAGRVPGIIASNSSGEPGYDGASILIRGKSTIGDNSPLVVIDGVANRLGGLERMDPQDIESVSVLKDASAAIYGAQSANGVIIVTTKKGRLNKPELKYSFSQGIVMPTFLPKMADAATFASIQNEILYYQNPTAGLNQRYSAGELEKFRNGVDPLNYPNVNWLKSLLKDYSIQNKHNLSLRGGTESADYYVSLGKTFQNAIYKNGTTRYDQFNVLANIGVKVNERLKLGIGLSGRKEDRLTPQGIGAADIFQSLYLTYPITPVYYPNGLVSSGNGDGRNPAVMVNGNIVGDYNSSASFYNGTL
ncbi:MAG: SusC/RagA family TonB-linked outer membrane protein, partial [Mucilaginibacter sp.]|nr:SusC/RagA family TonB-linked outer membrane protein [Mucilaginibacter sp.]